MTETDRLTVRRWRAAWRARRRLYLATGWSDATWAALAREERLALRVARIRATLTH
jgi:hypothetical protein